MHIKVHELFHLVCRYSLHALCNPIIQSPIHGAHCQKIYNLTVRAVETGRKASSSDLFRN
jgi:hypothetical protein